ncbi:MAG: ATP-binding domain-containing protein, partial [Clostridiales bacterium]|nr:ATP-binding domain-containing protein [Clostridiales bacterium]
QFEIEDSEEAQTRLQNLQEFAGAAREFENQSQDKTLEAFLENVSLVTDLDRQEDAPRYVTLMTLHSAKGLEYDAVFLCGMEEGIFPSMRSAMDEKRMEEERRLCYVGLTRAKSHLYLSFARRRMLFNQIAHNPPSIFIKEIPERLLADEWTETTRRSLTQEQPRTAPPRRNLSFGAPGMAAGSTSALNIPGVQKGFVPSAAHGASEAMEQLFRAGDRVLHRKFGVGVVQEVKGQGRDKRIVIAFTAYGTKEFSLAIAPIVKVEE